MKMYIDTRDVAEAIKVEIASLTTDPPTTMKSVGLVAAIAFRMVVGRLQQDPRRHAKLAAAIGMLESVDADPAERDGAAEYLRGELGV
jgi:hypothetical protein